MTLLTLLPVLVAAVVGAWLLAQRERDTFRRGAEDQMRALSTAVDGELRSHVETLAALAGSPSLREGDLEAFHARAVQHLREQPEWFSISLALPSGQQVVSPLLPYGTALPDIPDTESFTALLRTRQPVIGSVVVGPITQRHDFAVRVPVTVDGEVRYVLSAIVKPEAIQRLLDAQRIPAESVGVIVDGKKTIVARTLERERTLGQPASRDLQAALAASAHGSFSGRTREGLETYTAFAVSAYSGYGVAVGHPRRLVEQAANQALWTLLAGAAVALALAVAVAFWFGRRIAVPVAWLAAQARALGGAELPPRAARAATHGRVRELDVLADALDQADGAVRSRDAVQRQLAAVTDNASVALFMVDAERRCSFVNPAGVAMSGFARAAFAGRRLHEVIARLHGDGTPLDPADAESPPIERAFAAGRPLSGEEAFVHANGAHYAVAYTASPIHDGDSVVGAVLEVRDISADKRAEAERAELLEREQRARREAEAANQAKDEFLAMLGHELRNPLGAIGNATHVIELRPGSEPARSAQAVIRRQLTHLTRLVDDLLDASRVTTGKIVLARAPLALDELVRRSIAALPGVESPLHRRMRIELEPVWVHGDETRLEQVVGNLLGNAFRYTPPSGAVEVRLTAHAGEAVLTVGDEGIGIAPYMLPRIFELFVQGEREVDRVQGGLGIGLTLVRRLVQLHGGHVEAASEGPGRGSVFTVRLPRIEAPPAVPAAPTRASAVRRCRVLVVEDNDDARTTLADLLEAAGLEVHARADGTGGVEAALALQPDVALVDIGLPGLSGVEVARRVRADAGGQAMLLVALTGYGQPADQEASLAAGFDTHLVKPVDPERLLALIERHAAAALE